LNIVTTTVEVTVTTGPAGVGDGEGCCILGGEESELAVGLEHGGEAKEAGKLEGVLKDCAPGGGRERTGIGRPEALGKMGRSVGITVWLTLGIGIEE
jgi:hypothetical protein